MERSLQRFWMVPAVCLAMMGLIMTPRAMALINDEGPSEEGSQPQLTSYQTALLYYKTGQYDTARTAIDSAEKEKPGDPGIEILKSRILTELGDFKGAEAALKPLDVDPASLEVVLALGDVYLRKKDDRNAVKFYELALQSKPGNPDIMLKLVYARIGTADLIVASKLASELRPLDPDHPCYYFAKAALAQATGQGEAAEADIETVRTIYGITVTNRYLETYLKVFASSPSTNTPATPAGTPAATNTVPVPTGAKP